MINDEAAYFHARITGDDVVVSGLESCTLGNRLEPETGREPEGVFATWRWDGEKLTVRNDRYGYYPLFYFQRAGEIGVSPSLCRLVEAGAPADLDYRSLSVFLRFGSFLYEDTPFEHIRALPPGCLIEWTRDGFAMQSGGPLLSPPEEITLDEAIETYRRLFRDAISRRLPPTDRFTVPLSGGKDSRHMLFELCEQGYKPPFTITSRYFPPLDTTDVGIAASIAAALGVEHVIVEAAPSEFRAELWKHGVAPLGSIDSGWMFGMTEYMTGRVDAVYDGIGGDVLSSDGFAKDWNVELVRTERFTEFADTLLERIGLKKLVRPAIYERMRREEAIRYLAGAMEEHAGTADPVNSFYIWHRTRRLIALAPYAVYAPIQRVFSPFLDHRLFDFLNTIPVSLKMNCILHIETIRRSYPEYADIPYMDRSTGQLEITDTDRRFIREFAAFVLKNRPCRMLRYRYLIPRLLAGLLAKKHAATSHSFIRLVVYLYRLEELATRGRPR